MPNTTVGEGVKKETVYGGPTPQARNSSALSGMPPGTTGTVYNGPSAGTVYNGPAAGATVYNGPTSNGNAYNQRAVPRAGVAGNGPAAVKGSNFFFAIAIFSALNTALILSGATTVLGSGTTASKTGGASGAFVVINIVIVGIFVLLGIAARSGSKAAFIIGMVIYALDTATLLFSGQPQLHVAGIVVHTIFLVGLFNAYRQL